MKTGIYFYIIGSIFVLTYAFARLALNIDNTILKLFEYIGTAISIVGIFMILRHYFLKFKNKKQ